MDTGVPKILRIENTVSDDIFDLMPLLDSTKYGAPPVTIKIHMNIKKIIRFFSTRESFSFFDNNHWLTLETLQLDEYHSRLEDFSEEDEDANSDDDNNSAPQNLQKIAANQHKSKGFKMEVMEFWDRTKRAQRFDF